jgi:predicted dehydrogenase
MQPGNLSRRGFLRRSLAGLVAAGLPAWYAREILADDQERAVKARRPASPSDTIVMGAIGIGSPQSRGRDIYNHARSHKGVRYVAACDVDARHLKRAVEMMKQDGSSEAKGYKDFRELLDRSDINAVTIAVPDHWHTLIALDALRKGKDVYCEKPLTLTIDEGKALVKAVRETGRVLQVGSQQRSEYNGRFRLACELVRNGRIGKVKRVETRIGKNPTSPPIPQAAIPEGLDWDWWLGPAPKVDFVELHKDGQTYTRGHYQFRWWYEYSGGKMTDWGAHHNDIAQWGLGADGSGPVAVEARGKAPSSAPNRYNCHPEFEVTYTYADGTHLICSSRQREGSPDPKKGKTGRSHDNGVLFVGDKDQWIFVNREVIEASDPKLIDEPLPPNAVRLYHANNHMGNFLECTRSRKKPICDVEVGHRSVTVCHLGVIALRSGKKLRWDPQQEQFVGDSEANGWLSRPMRAPWKLEG